MLLGRSTRFMQPPKDNISSPTRYPMDEGSVSMPMFFTEMHFKLSIPHSISGKFLRFEHSSRLKYSRDLNMRLFGKLVRLGHLVTLK
ncbi:hypothetical protein CIPAW_05G247500 [Carya illinoinensis]|uniref:Uncharacterized protein n=1 Tax=Carya illinoinensis TaxID=32201 RepID=A0A8T1QM44_CARIL|nr:hypothetical protein CIPAW_05G247500 [Carya illinoinensis]